ncbi:MULTISPECIES: 3,4-dihydroxy-2-butanone-4-phosphate synthase [Actibacterium]|uniref:3,4-dihydroxy-2-butanone 4-phosphate synthase n=1 Tax=Actibacterium naphthalenivorans TaxID=1614693 RepID=A0A840C718_9RHOB|nr:MULTISPECIES: 3,4-dihydroxy-2-butanone-4-phosphate synthase [Actibacterium]ALG91646.1 3,4-dihydroxy-2-butanone 4-phosphate synthase [Actibacterium sp. EMB200-NS6]MBB4021714.1 3,4-dihydroxy 2-butanone 4-phosphate synthase/GTP cyclohydrolase II [Actibacterium naphthalenivorans]
MNKPAEPGTIRGSAISSPEEIIEEARNGRMFILVDDEDRENEGDLVIPAQMATPDAINFMAKYGRGLICLAMPRERIEALGLDLMSKKNETQYETAFTVSIEAREGVTTGISAADRARTINVAIDPGKTAHDIVTPGHVFPLIARDGGVLVRAGHTEAAVDVSRLAGLTPAGVICEIMKEDGTMARLDDLIGFAREHNLKIGTIRDLIAYRRKHDRIIEFLTEQTFNSRWGGDWTVKAFRNRADGSEQLALQKGEVDPDKPMLVRMHQITPFADLFAEVGERSDLLSRSMEMIAQEGAGVVVVLNKVGQDYISRAIQMHRGERNTPDDDMRDYGVGAQILAELDIHEMILLTNTQHSLVGLDAYGLTILGERPID